jgi:hypothetical protein
LAGKDDAAGHLSAVREELDAWDRSQRDAQRISDIWCDRLHADKITAKIVDESKSGGVPQRGRDA